METDHTETPNEPSHNEEEITPSKKGAIYQLQIVFIVAFVLATLFTTWTPGVSIPSNDWENVSFAPVPTPTLAENNPTKTPRTRPLVGIVAGHWGNDSGSVCNDGLTEAEVNLEIASLVQKYLTEQGYDVDLLKEFDLGLTGYEATALVSIHADSCDYINDLATGFKVAQAMSSKRPERVARLTACLRSRYTQITGMPLHSTSVTGDMTSYHAFGEINDSTAAVIIETGFLNLDRQFLTQTPELAAQGIADGVVCFINNESITSPLEQPTP